MDNQLQQKWIWQVLYQAWQTLKVRLLCTVPAVRPQHHALLITTPGVHPTFYVASVLLEH